MTQLILERGTFASAELRAVDDLFSKLKKCETHTARKQILKQINKELQKAFKIKVEVDIIYFGVCESNCVILPLLSKVEIRTKEDFVKLGNIETVNILIGWKLIQQITNRQLTAIILHELGHLINHISKTVSIISTLLGPIVRFLSEFKSIGTILLPLTIITSRTFAWTEHISEYNADKFAIENGYGDDLASAFKKFNLQDNRENIKLTAFRRTIESLKDFIFGTSHPEYKSRVLTIVNKIKRDYSDKYKSKKINALLNHYTR
jgi:hypothetical protein